jgi:hypothetical protein
MQHDVTLIDAMPSLGGYIGDILPALDDSLARIGDGDWKPGTRDVVLRFVSMEMVRTFAEDEWNPLDSIERLEQEAAIHLARYTIAQSRATVLRARA